MTIAYPGMCLVGAAGRNAGKTLFACRLVALHSSTRPVVAVKVTTVHERGGPCPRGGEGCGVCAALDEPYCLTEEHDAESGKDTARLLRAGASRVLWLRVLETHLEEGVRALLSAIGPDVPCVCESNSLRLAVKPGVFVVLADARSTSIKPSARAVMELADRVIRFDGEDFDVPPAAVALEEGVWRLRTTSDD